MIDIRNAASQKGISWYFRRRRMKCFIEFIESIDNKTVKILDLGGTVYFWERLGLAEREKFQITLLNLKNQVSNFDNIKCLVGDVTDINTFPMEDFDIVFSNSVIEHLFSYDNQKKMATNVLQSAKLFFVQTPNYYFPVEPHFIFPFFHFFPQRVKKYLIAHFSLGAYTKLKGVEAQSAIDEIKLLTPRQMQLMFPTANIVFEKFFLFNKSIVAQNFY